MLKKKNLIKTDRLVLKNISLLDQEIMVELLCNKDIKKYYMIPNFDSKEDVIKLFKKQIEFCLSDSHFEYGIYLNDVLIGFINECKIENDTIELGYVISPNYQNNGFASESLKAAIDELFRMGYKHIIAGYFSENIASKRVMEKCSMHKLDFEEDIEYNGVKHHTLYYGVDKI